MCYGFTALVWRTPDFPEHLVEWFDSHTVAVEGDPTDLAFFFTPAGQVPVIFKISGLQLHDGICVRQLIIEIPQVIPERWIGLSTQTSKHNAVGVKAHHTMRSLAGLSLRTNEDGPSRCTQILTGKKATHLAYISLVMAFAHAHLLTTAVHVRVQSKIEPARLSSIDAPTNLLLESHLTF